MEEGRNAGEINKEELDAFIKTVKNNGAVEGFSTNDFSIKQLIDIEKLQKKGLLTVELRTALVPVCIIMVKRAGGTEVAKSM